MSLRHDRLELLDRYLRIPTISRQVTPEMVEAVNEHYVLRHFYRQIELYAAIVSSRPM